MAVRRISDDKNKTLGYLGVHYSDWWDDVCERVIKKSVLSTNEIIPNANLLPYNWTQLKKLKNYGVFTS